MTKGIIIFVIVTTIVLTGCVNQPIAPSPPDHPDETAPISTTVPSKGKTDLVRTAGPRELPARLLGLQAVPLYEHLIDDPTKVAIAKEMSPAFVRFPGGMVGNYYNWRSGHLELDVRPDSSATYRFYANLAEQVRKLHPQGVFIEQYHQFSQEIGAEIVLLVNLETSSIPDQVAWFKSMRDQGVLPRYIELGNEFWLAMLGDPNVLRKWPDAPTSMRVMKEYRDSLQPYVFPGTKFAVQAAASRFNASVVDGKLVYPASLKRWDEALRPEPWFDAVTIHMYPAVERIVGTEMKAALPEGMDRVFPSLMARCDQGVDEAIAAIEKQLGGKEIWITEFSGSFPGIANLSDPTTPILGLNIHLTTRMLMKFLEHPSVTMALYHMLNFSGGPLSLFRRDIKSNTYIPIGSAIILKWFNEAANGGAVYRKLTVNGARLINSGVTAEESYYDIEALELQKGDTTTVIIHNASPEAKKLTLAGFISGKSPARIESSQVIPTEDYLKAAPSVRIIPASDEVEIPPYSVSRIIWQ